MSKVENTARGIGGFFKGLFHGARHGIAAGATVGLAVGGVLAIIGTGGAVLPLLVTAAGIGAVAGGAGVGLLGSLMGIFKSGKDAGATVVDCPPHEACTVAEPSCAPAPAVAPECPEHRHDTPHDASHAQCSKFQDQVTSARAAPDAGAQR